MPIALETHMETETELNPFEDYQGFLEEFQNESPRAVVIVGASFSNRGTGIYASGFEAFCYAT